MDRPTMGRILKEMDVLDQYSHMQIEEEKLELDLHVGVLKQFIFVFYWHKMTHLKSASRKEVSYNFICYHFCHHHFSCTEMNPKA
jgi:hypothetical protein